MDTKDVRNTERSPLLARSRSYASEAPLEADESISLPKSAAGSPPLGVARGFAIVSALGLLIFLQTSNISLLTTIQGSIAEELDAYSSTPWFATVYLIGMSSITPLAGRLCQLFRPQSFILVSSSILALGVAVTSLAPDLPWFLVGRALTGIGAAGNFPVGLILIVDLTSLKRRGLFMGLLNTGFTLGVAFGAVLAGLLEPVISWRGVFGLQTPFAILAGCSLYFAMPTRPVTADNTTMSQSIAQKLRGIDYLGVFTLVAFIILLLFGLSSPSGVVWESIILAIPFLAAFAVTEAYYASNPIIPIALLRSRSILLTCFSTVLLMMSRWAVLFYMPVYAIAVRGWAPAKAGTVLFAVNGGFAAGGLLAGWLHIRRAGSFYVSCIVVLLIFAITIFLLGRTATATSSIPLFILITFANGLATGASLNYTLVHVLHLTDPATHFIVTSLVAAFRGVAGSFATAIGGGVFQKSLHRDLSDGFASEGLDESGKLTARLLGNPRLVLKLTGLERSIAQESYSSAIRSLFYVAAAVAILAAVVQAGTGWRGFTAKADEEDESREVNSHDVS